MASRYSCYVDNVQSRISHNPTFKGTMTWLLLNTMRPRYNKQTNKLLVTAFDVEERIPNSNWSEIVSDNRRSLTERI